MERRKSISIRTWDKTTGKLLMSNATQDLLILGSITVQSKDELVAYPLEDLDEMRDLILTTKGSTTLQIAQNSGSPQLFKSFAQRNAEKN